MVEKSSKSDSGFKKLLQFIRLPITSSTPEPSNFQQTKQEPRELIAQFTVDELKNLTPNRQRGSNLSPTQALSMTALLNQMMGASNSIQQQINTNQALVELTPEIIQAMRIFVSSILSPNDMQTADVQIVLEDSIGGLVNAEISKSIGKEITDYFNRTVKMGQKFPTWIEDTLFKHGSKSILIVPRKTTADLAKSKYLSPATEGLSFNLTSLENLVSSTENFKYIHAMEALDGFQSAKMTDEVTKAKKALAQIIKNYGTLGPSVAPLVSDDITLLAQKQEVVEKQSKLVYDSIIDSEFGKTLILDHIDSEGLRPTIIELPPQAVVPVCMPGNSSEHIGYYVLTDKWNCPIDFDPSAMNSSSMSNSAALNNAYATATNDANPQTVNVFNQMAINNTWQSMTSVFNVAVLSMLKTHMKNKGFENVTFGQSNAITSCILFNMLFKAEVKLIYVPEPLMIYFRVDHRKDGTGKAIIEDVKIPLMLRAILFVAGAMGEINNAANQKVLTVDFDDKVTNPEQMLDMIRSVYMDKYMINFSQLNASSISADIASRSVSVVPNKLPGLEGSMSIGKENVQSARPGLSNISDLIDRLTKISITGIGIPHNLINETSEGEYARSVTSANIIFANIIRTLQVYFRAHGNKFIINYSKLSSEVRDIIKRCITGTKDDAEDKLNDKNAEPKTNDGTADAKHQDEDKLVKAIIEHLDISFPPPNVVVTETQFKEIAEFMEAVEQMFKTMFPPEYVFNANETEKNDILSIVAHMKSQLVMNYLGSLGIDVFKVPSVEEFWDKNADMLSKFQVMITNISKSINDRAKGLKPGDMSSQPLSEQVAAEDEGAAGSEENPTI